MAASSISVGHLAMSAPSSQQNGAQAPPCPYSAHAAAAPLPHSAAAAAGEASRHSFTQRSQSHACAQPRNHHSALAASLRAPAPPPPPSRSNALLSSLLSLFSQHEAEMRAAREEIAANNAKADALVAAADMLSVARAHQQQQQQQQQQYNDNNNSSTNANTTTAASHRHHYEHQQHPQSSSAATPPLSFAAIGNGIAATDAQSSSRVVHTIDHHPHRHASAAGESEGERATQQHRPIPKEGRHGQDVPPHAHSLATAAAASDKANTSLPASGIDSSLPPTAPDAASDAAAVPLPIPADAAARGVAAGEDFDNLGGRSRFFHQFMGGQTPSASQQSAEGGGSGDVGGLGMGSTAGEAPAAVAEAVRHAYPHLPIHPPSTAVANSCAAVAPAVPQPVGHGGAVPPSVGVATPNAPTLGAMLVAARQRLHREERALPQPPQPPPLPPPSAALSSAATAVVVENALAHFGLPATFLTPPPSASAPLSQQHSDSPSRRPLPQALDFASASQRPFGGGQQGACPTASHYHQPQQQQRGHSDGSQHGYGSHSRPAAASLHSHAEAEGSQQSGAAQHRLFGMYGAAPLPSPSQQIADMLAVVRARGLGRGHESAAAGSTAAATDDSAAPSQLLAPFGKAHSDNTGNSGNNEPPRSGFACGVDASGLAHAAAAGCPPQFVGSPARSADSPSTHATTAAEDVDNSAFVSPLGAVHGTNLQQERGDGGGGNTYGSVEGRWGTRAIASTSPFRRRSTLPAPPSSSAELMSSRDGNAGAAGGAFSAHQTASGTHRSVPAASSHPHAADSRGHLSDPPPPEALSNPLPSSSLLDAAAAATAAAQPFPPPVSGYSGHQPPSADADRHHDPLPSPAPSPSSSAAAVVPCTPPHVREAFDALFGSTANSNSLPTVASASAAGSSPQQQQPPRHDRSTVAGIIAMVTSDVSTAAGAGGKVRGAGPAGAKEKHPRALLGASGAMKRVREAGADGADDAGTAVAAPRGRGRGRGGRAKAPEPECTPAEYWEIN